MYFAPNHAEINENTNKSAFLNTPSVSEGNKKTQIGNFNILTPNPIRKKCSSSVLLFDFNKPN